MAIPFNDQLRWDNYTNNPNWHQTEVENDTPLLSSYVRVNPAKRALKELFAQIHPQLCVRGVQCIRDTLRLVLKVPVRSMLITPIWLKKNWGERERSKINAKLTGYSFVQLISVPAKFLVALAALVTSAVSFKKAHMLLDASENWTKHLDGRASQLEVLKEEGAKKAASPELYKAYKQWIYSIDPKLCRP